MRNILAAVLIALSASLAAAQVVPTPPGQPFVIPVTVATSSAQAVPANLNRKKIVFVNPSATATISVCPTITRGATTVTCTLNGAGSIAILPFSSFTIEAAGTGVITVSQAWNAIASAGATPLTVFEFE